MCFYIKIIMASSLGTLFMAMMLKTMAPILVLIILPLILTANNKTFNNYWTPIMTIGMWFQTHSQFEQGTPTRQYYTSKHSRSWNHHCKKYIQVKHPQRQARTFDKVARVKPRLYFTFPSEVRPTKLKRQAANQEDTFTYDTDSFIIGIDNHSSCVMDNNKDHFIGKIKPTRNQEVISASGTLQIQGEGTVEWRIEDDDGRVHKKRFQAKYVPDLPICLLPPQCWSQQAKDNFPQRNGTFAMDTADACILYWSQKQFKKTIPWMPGNMNVARFRSANGTKRYQVYATTLDYTTNNDQMEHVCYSTTPNIIPDDDDEPPPSPRRIPTSFSDRPLVPYLPCLE